MKQSVVTVLLLLAASISPAAQNQTQTTKADPISCWWRTTAGAVRVGEIFSAVLTCAVLETPDVKVVVDQSKLEPSVVQFAPFEVTGGSHAADLRTDDRRFFQYEYKLRIIAENVFGKDASIPETKISYRVQSHTGQPAGGAGPKETIEGRDQTYLMPAMPMRVLSLVPSEASDIRDAGTESFGDLDQRAFRANLLTVIGGVLFVVAGLLALLAVVRVFAKYRKPATEADRLIPDTAVLRAVGRELNAVQRAREDGGWSPELAGRGLAALRVAATYALGRRVAKETLASVAKRRASALKPEEVIDGQLVLNTGWRRKPIVVSASATPQNLAREIARMSARNGGGRRVEQLQSLHDALGKFTAAGYGRPGDNGVSNDAGLDASIAETGTIVRRLTLEHSWPMRRFSRTASSAQQATSKVWSR
jgi:hypothetical protein